ncbi:hypothetical protein [Candidatus Thiosymbion oneisti]|uniref:hypothetical protein n=1 Tax=Candidatus Thiosymbion oneisti TaxID=589554 RepID=UPI000A3DE77C|nr:hypothetical protein [Candidatus Thiosymbion oneisti]
MRIISFAHRFRNWLFPNDESFPTVDSADYNRPTVLFITSIVFYCIYLLAMQPEWVLGGEMWAEMATNYYPNSTASSIAVKFFSTDAGYIPLPQRILAFIGSSLNLPATSIPYFYTWSAILTTGIMVGAFCLRPFRVLVKSDFLRFWAAIAVLMLADFGTRTFINFTYFSAFLVAVVTALALVERSHEVPRWSWFVPIFMLSKPAVLSVLPAMILVAFVGKTRFRLITIVSSILGLAQLIRMAFSHSAGTMHWVSKSDFTLIDKLIASIKYFVGLLGAFFAGRLPVELYQPMWFGLLLLVVCVYILMRRRTHSGALILVGLSILFFSVLLNVFALSNFWSPNMERLVSPPEVTPSLGFRMYRHSMVGYCGVILVVVGMISAVVNQNQGRFYSAIPGVAPTLFLVWFYISGWFSFAGTLNRTPDFPRLNNSQWQNMASVIDSGAAVCVPTEPITWLFRRNCSRLTPIGPSHNLYVDDFNQSHYFQPLPVSGMSSSVDLPVQEVSDNRALLALAVFVKPITAQAMDANAQADIVMKDGSTKYLLGSRELPSEGGLLMLSSKVPISINEIREITLSIDRPVELAYLSNDPIVMWMGN